MCAPFQAWQSSAAHHSPQRVRSSRNGASHSEPSSSSVTKGMTIIVKMNLHVVPGLAQMEG